MSDIPSLDIEGIVPECPPGKPAFRTGRGLPRGGTETSHGPSSEAWAFTPGSALSPGQAGDPAAAGLGFSGWFPESVHRNYHRSGMMTVSEPNLCFPYPLPDSCHWKSGLAVSALFMLLFF